MTGKGCGGLWVVCLAIVLTLASVAPVTAAPLVQAEQTYVVQAGDTLSGIAARFGVTVEAIKAANRLDDADLIYEGQQLAIPPAQDETEPSASTPTPSPTPTATQVYVVQAGDTLSGIAGRFGLSTQELMQANDLSDPDYLAVGQRLIIPGAGTPPSYPAPFASVQLTPAPVVQGQTLVVRVDLAKAHDTAQEVTALSGQFDGRPAYFVTGPSGGWGLVGIHALQPTGSYSLTLSARLRNGSQVVAVVPLRVRAGSFTTEDVLLSPERESLLDPKLVQAEQAHLKDVWSEFSPRPMWEGPFRLPLEDVRVTSFFGTRRSYNGGPISEFHSGLDMGAEEGTPVYATAAGRVVLAELLTVRGNTTLIDHGLGVFSGYFHQSRILVQVGQMVQAGDLIGYVGNTGLSSGAHLHWEMRVAGIAVDPQQWTQMTMP